MEQAAFDAVVESPVGPLGVRLEGEAVAAVAFLPPETPLQSAHSAWAEVAVDQLGAYFADPRSPFTLPLAFHGTPFQQRVWQALREIPPGRTLTYGQLAKRLGSGARAVGGACRANRCPLLVPCHRVVAVGGPGGFAGATSGRWLEIKDWLLRHEARAT